MNQSYSVAVKTHYISACHIVFWLQMQRSKACKGCYILLNNEDGILDHCLTELPKEMKKWVVPFTIDTLKSLGLAIVPSHPRWRNSHRNGDYGFYLLIDYLKANEPDHSVVLLDQDLGLIGDSWDNYIDSLPWEQCDAMMLTHGKSHAGWPHYAAAARYFDPVYSGLWGFTVLPLWLISDLLIVRHRIAEEAKQLYLNDSLDFHSLSNSLSMKYWPICEALVGSELARRSLTVHRILSGQQNANHHFRVQRSEWSDTPSLVERIRDGEVVLFHPLKEPAYGWKGVPS